MKVIQHLTHPTEGWGTTIYDDGVKAHWIDGRSSVIVLEASEEAKKDLGYRGIYTPIWGEGNNIHHEDNLRGCLINRSMTDPTREMTPTEVISHSRAMSHYYGAGSRTTYYIWNC